MNNSLWHGNCSFVASLLLLVVIAVDVIVVDVVVVVVFAVVLCAAQKTVRPCDAQLRSAPQPLPYVSWGVERYTHVYIPHSAAQRTGYRGVSFLRNSLPGQARAEQTRPGQGRAVLAAFLSFLLSFLIIFLDVFPAFPLLLLLFTKKSAHTLTHMYTLIPCLPPTPHSLACCFAIPLKVAAFSSTRSRLTCVCVGNSTRHCCCYAFHFNLLAFWLTKCACVCMCVFVFACAFVLNENPLSSISMPGHIRQINWEREHPIRSQCSLST